ncbi:tyrosine-protein phosphatase [Halanaerobium congolense]|uniref:tyrosine-protein phosphatase n=1 Tax=Halanaerobium congolense TaxID=54121 RepID=UPI001F3CCF35|nr:CpsB/CapC family capsule biosynthesis tyrosine phosphatase [Halanaerobium congolense]
MVIKMIDLHSHILTGVDDGAASAEESLAVLKAMEAKGVKKVAATSHYPLYEIDNYKGFILDKLQQLRQEAEAAGLEIEILSGSEILIDRKTAELFYRDQLLTLNETNYILLETYPNTYPDYFSDLIHDLKAMGYQIIIAHPEKYPYIQADFSLLYQWVEEYGLNLMLNSSSLVGKHGSKTKETAEKILRLGLPQLMASDTHGIKRRTFSLDQGLKRAESLKPGSRDIFLKNAEAVTKNHKLEKFEIKREEKSILKKFFSFFSSSKDI